MNKEAARTNKVTKKRVRTLEIKEIIIIENNNNKQNSRIKPFFLESKTK
jgi:hypothetical protein